MYIEVKIAKIADISLYLAMLSIVRDRGFMSTWVIFTIVLVSFQPNFRF